MRPRTDTEPDAGVGPQATNGTPAAATPAQFAPTEVVPTEVVPTDATPADAALTDAAPTDAAPAEATATRAASRSATSTFATPTRETPTRQTPTTETPETLTSETPTGATPPGPTPPSLTPPGPTPRGLTAPGLTPPGLTPPGLTPPGATPPGATPTPGGGPSGVPVPAAPVAASAGPRAATPRFLLAHPAHAIALGFGAGLSPLAPGTVGTLWAWLAFVVLDRWLDDAQWGALIALAAAVGWWACTVTARHLRDADPSAIVWDEVVAFWSVLWLVTPSGWIGQLGAFLLFRLFDAAKPGPVRWADARFKRRAGGPIGWAQGFGILFDDAVAALCTLLVIALWRFL
jgi:phosphatidylglycerophosphatase A